MNCEIISVGTELLLGDIVNTNARFLAKELAALGVGVYRQTTVGDNPERLKQAFAEAFSRADMIITTGGLGPTADDLTKETAAALFNKKMILDEGILESIESLFTRQGQKMPVNNVKQAEIPEGAVILDNPNGTAPGCIISENGKTIILLPGPPFEAEPMFQNKVLPYLQKLQDCVIVSTDIKMCGIGESAMEELVKDMMDAQKNPTIAPYAGMGEVRLRLTARAADDKACEALIAPVKEEIYQRLSGYIYGENETTLEEAVVNRLKERGLTLACAESCTGGMVAARIVNVPGVSEVLREAIVAYSNESKIKRLGVKLETIAKFGAVSPETAMEMAEGAAKTCGADVGLSITGVAGPSGGTEEKPAGLVYFGLYFRGKTEFFETRTTGDRQRVRTRATVRALDFLLKTLQKSN